MMTPDKQICTIEQILDRYKAPGLTVILEDGAVVDLTYTAVRAAAADLEHDTEAIPPDHRAAVDFQPCSVCPVGSNAAMCHALPSILPFLETFNAHQSYQRVKAVYVDHARDHDSQIVHASRTSLQRALQFVAMQSVLSFCEAGQLYRRFFNGIIPFTSAEDMAERICANVMLEKKGDAVAVSKTLNEMRETLTVTMLCQMKRLRLVSQSDAFANAFVNLHLAFQMLDPETIESLRDD